MKESRLYNFLDTKKGFAVSFLDGKKLIHDILLIHNVGPNAADYYKNTILTAQQMINFLKAGESLGIYIDSESPYFRFKIEMGQQGTMRTLLLPEEFSDFPEKVTGAARVSKIFPKQTPYTSIIQLQKTAAHSVINKILNESYQTNSQVLVSEHREQSVMYTKLPPTNVNKEGEVEDDITLQEYILMYQPLINSLFKDQLEDEKKIIERFELQNFNYLGSREVKFFCPCSKNRMMMNLMNLHHNDLNDVFHKDESIEIRCDYCNTLYEISKSELSTLQ